LRALCNYFVDFRQLLFRRHLAAARPVSVCVVAFRQALSNSISESKLPPAILI
jgi:hypothetical protein